MIFYSAMYYMPAEYSLEVSNLNSHVFTVYLIFSCHIITLLHLYFMAYRGHAMVIIALIDIACLIITISAQIGDTTNNTVYELAFFEGYKNSNLVVGFVTVIMVIFVVDWVWWELLRSQLKFPIFHWMRIMALQNICFESEVQFNDYVLDKFTPGEEVTHVVRRCFGASDEIDKVLDSMLDRNSQDTANYSKYTLHIYSKTVRGKYAIHIMQKFLGTLRFELGISSLCLIVFSILMALINSQVEMIFFVNIGISICVFCVFLITLTKSFEINLDKYTWIIVFSFAVVAAFNSLVRNADHSLLSIILVVFAISNYSMDFAVVFVLMSLQFIWYCFSYLLIYDKLGAYLWTYDTDNMQAITYALVNIIFLVLLINMVALAHRYQLEVLVKREFIAGSVLQSRSNLTNDLLKLLLPSFVLDRISTLDIADNNIDDDAGEVTILFCDIADFDKIVKEKEKDIVKILDSIFRRFDELCKENGCQKIETVGKTYMACGGLKYIEQTISAELKLLNPSQRVLNLSKSMLLEIKNYEDLNLKIGVHRGPCMMGIIGYHKPQFSLIGDAVNFTSRHCTTGEKGHIMVSIEAYNHINSITFLKSRDCTYKEVSTEMKGKGVIPVYHVFLSENKIKKRLMTVIERLKAAGEPLTEDLEIFDNIFFKSRLQIKKKVAAGKVHKLLKDIITMARANINKDAGQNSSGFIKESSQIPINYKDAEKEDIKPNNYPSPVAHPNKFHNNQLVDEENGKMVNQGKIQGDINLIERQHSIESKYSSGENQKRKESDGNWDLKLQPRPEEPEQKINADGSGSVKVSVRNIRSEEVKRRAGSSRTVIPKKAKKNLGFDEETEVAVYSNLVCNT